MTQSVALARAIRKIKRRDQAIVELRDVYSTAAICGMSHADLLDRIGKIKSTTLKNATQAVVAYFDGYRAALDEATYRSSLVFGGYYQGKFYSCHSERADYYAHHGIEPSAFIDDSAVVDRGHYWSTTKEPKPFFISRSKR